MALAAVAALSGQRSLERAQQGLRDVRGSGDQDVGRAVPRLRRAREDVADAERALQGVPFRLVSLVPVLGRSFDAERAVVEVSRHVLDAAVVAAERVPVLTGPGGRVDLEAVAGLERALVDPTASARRALDALASTPTALTPAPVGAGVDRALEALTPAVTGLEHAVVGARTGRGLLGGTGPRRVLVALANNAELRGSGGYVSSFATGTIDRGRLVLGPLQDVEAVADPPATARRVPSPPEYAQDYGVRAGDTTQFRSWNMSPEFPDSALVGSRIAAALLGTAPDTVVLLDVPAMAALARLGGGRLDVGAGRTVSAAELQAALLVDSYAEAAGGKAQLARRAELQRAASTAVSRLLTSKVAPTKALSTMADLAKGRHLLVWSGRPAEQADLVRLGLAGTVRAAAGQDLLHVAVNNVGANKLDIYVDRSVELEAVVGARSTVVVQRLRLVNRAPAGLVPYVAGRRTPGTATSRVEFSLPPDAQVEQVRQDGAVLDAYQRRGAGRLRLATRVALARGSAVELEVRYRIPQQAGGYRLRALPQGLATDARLRVTVRAEPGIRLRAAGGAPQGGPGEGGPGEGGPGVVQDGSFAEAVEVVVLPGRLGWRDRLARFWDSPVRLG